MHKVGVYLRLSREDENCGESESIKNQKDFICAYIINKGWSIVDFYIDDGYSGTNFNRPGFKRMLEDAESGKIDTIVTKDLSRLGRDYIETGHYLERYFPNKNIRYIAISDGIDTFVDSSANELAPFRAVINDLYAKDISKKVRTAFKTKTALGKFIGSIAPYGYVDVIIRLKVFPSRRTPDFKKLFWFMIG